MSQMNKRNRFGLMIIFGFLTITYLVYLVNDNVNATINDAIRY